MKYGIAAAALLGIQALVGCYDDEPYDSDDSTPTLVVENRGDETAVLELWYHHGDAVTYREVELGAKQNFVHDYPDLGTLSVMMGRMSDGVLLLQDKFVRDDFCEYGTTLTIVLLP